MDVLYDTRSVQPLDRYEYYCEGAANEFVPVAVGGRPLPDLLAVMSMTRIGDFMIELVTAKAATPVVARRTEPLIRASDPECYRVLLNVNACVPMEQAGNQLLIRERDIGLFDVSLPWQTTVPAGALVRVIMLTFPRTLMPIAERSVRPLVGTVVPRNLPGRSLIAQTLIQLTSDEPMESGELADPDLLQECTVGLIRRWLGKPAGISPDARRLLHLARIRAIVRKRFQESDLDPDVIAEAAHISPRYLHWIFEDAELSLMQLVKRTRLEECHRSLQDPALSNVPIKDITSACGYRRSDQFARDFRQRFGTSARDVRTLASQRPGVGRRPPCA